MPLPHFMLPPVRETIFPLPETHSLPFPQAREGAWELDFLLLRGFSHYLFKRTLLLDKELGPRWALPPAGICCFLSKTEGLVWNGDG